MMAIDTKGFPVKYRKYFLAASLTCEVFASSTTVSVAADDVNWPSFGRTFSEDRYSPLTQINTDSVKRLGLVWALELPGFSTVTSQPLAVDGVVYFAVGLAVVHAVDAKTGKLKWKYDPEVAKVAGPKLRYTWGSRGIAYWNGMVYVGTLDGRLIALDAKSGRPRWSTLTVDPNDDRTISGAPRVFNGKIIIGHGGGDVGTTRGYVTVYDARNGKQLWRFYTVPGNPAAGFENKAMELAAKTWRGEYWKFGGGATVWNAITYDPDFNRVYIATGNGLPWNQLIRSPGGGDNLFVSSIVALDADTGAYVWHYQVNPGETWDYDADMDMVLATISIGGEPRRVLMQAPKNGFFYVIDRETGRLLSAEKLGKVTWADHIDLVTGRPVEAPNTRYESGETLIWPSSAGVHNTSPMSYSPKTGFAYVPTMELPGYYNDRGINPSEWVGRPHTVNTGLQSVNADPPANLGSSALVAWDSATQRIAWKTTTPGYWNGGTIVTAGNLVFQGQVDGKFTAHAADTGATLWSFDARNGIVAPPVTYSVGGIQYVSVLVGLGGAPAMWGSISAQFGWQARINPRRLLTFALDGKMPLPRTPAARQAVPLDDPQVALDAVKVTRGNALFGSDCVPCHGAGAVSGGTAPDLRSSPIPLAASGFESVVRQGVLESRGMPRFQEFTDDDLESLREYLRARARESLNGAVSTGTAVGPAH
jgi:quinohemoprotein ethanol dehydrogenase